MTNQKPYKIPDHQRGHRKPTFPGRSMVRATIYIPDDTLPKLRRIGNQRLTEMIEREKV